MYAVLAPLFLLLIYGVPLIAAREACRSFPDGPFAVLALLLAIPVYVVAFVLVAGALARPYVSSIVPGKFVRDLHDPAYCRRRLYGLCWTTVYYMKPLYHFCLSLPPLKRLLFRLFGYRGSMDFTVYPDSWIRDLPLLDFGPGSYVSNRATIGTNVALRNGTLLVDRVTLGPRAMVGHLAMLSTGVVLEEGAEVGVGCAIGSKVVLHADADVAPCCAVGHLAEIGAGTRVGFMSWVGAGSRLGSGITFPPHASIPNRARVEDAAAAGGYWSSALGRLADLGRRLAPSIGDSRVDGASPAGRPAPGPAPAPRADGTTAPRRAEVGGRLAPADASTSPVASSESGTFRVEWNRFE